jgi:hypothetical protein
VTCGAYVRFDDALAALAAPLQINWTYVTVPLQDAHGFLLVPFTDMCPHFLSGLSIVLRKPGVVSNNEIVSSLSVPKEVHWSHAASIDGSILAILRHSCLCGLQTYHWAPTPLVPGEPSGYPWHPSTGRREMPINNQLESLHCTSSCTTEWTPQRLGPRLQLSNEPMQDVAEMVDTIGRYEFSEISGKWKCPLSFS